MVSKTVYAGETSPLTSDNSSPPSKERRLITKSPGSISLYPETSSAGFQTFVFESLRTTTPLRCVTDSRGSSGKFLRDLFLKRNFAREMFQSIGISKIQSIPVSLYLSKLFTSHLHRQVFDLFIK